MNYTISVEKDNIRKACWMIVVRDNRTDIITIPFRGGSKADARRMLSPCRFAFEAGMREFKRNTCESLYATFANIEEKRTP